MLSLHQRHLFLGFLCLLLGLRWDFVYHMICPLQKVDKHFSCLYCGYERVKSAPSHPVGRSLVDPRTLTNTQIKALKAKNHNNYSERNKATKSIEESCKLYFLSYRRDARTQCGASCGPTNFLTNTIIKVLKTKNCNNYVRTKQSCRT